MKSKKKLLFILPVVAFVFFHFLKLSSVPAGINIDEIGMAYDAWCLKNYGVDRNLNSFPVYFNNYGGGQSALYAYLYTIVLCFTKVSAFSIRIPIIIMGTIGIIYFGNTMYFIDENKELGAILAMGLLVVSPIFIHLFRQGLDCNLMLPMSMVSIYYSIVAIKSEKIGHYLLIGFLWGITLYTYILSYIAIPIFLILTLLYLLYLKKISCKNAVVFIIPLFILALPLVFVQVINIKGLDPFKLGIFTITKLDVYREGDVHFQDIFNIGKCKVLFNTIFKQDCYPFDSIEEFNNFYWISIPLAGIGLVYSLLQFVKKVMKKEFYEFSLFIFWFIGMIIVGLIIEDACYRINGIYGVIVFYIIQGILFIVNIFNSKKIIRYCLIMVISLVYLLYFAKFARFYYGEGYQNKYQADSQFITYHEPELTELLNELERMDISDDTIIYEGNTYYSYVYYAATVGVSPYEYQRIIQESEGDMFGNVCTRIVGLDWIEDGAIVAPRNTYTDYIQGLEERGYELKWRGDYYSIYTSPTYGKLGD